MSWNWWLLKDNVDFERTCRVPARSQLAQIFHDPLFYASFLIFFCLIQISYTPWSVKNQISNLSFSLMCFACVTEKEQQLQSIKTGALTCWYHWSPGRPPAVLQLLLEVCTGPCASRRSRTICGPAGSYLTAKIFPRTLTWDPQCSTLLVPAVIPIAVYSGFSFSFRGIKYSVQRNEQRWGLSHFFPISFSQNVPTKKVSWL